MDTVILEANEENIAKCAELLRRGEVVAFPTETVYGLGANALDEKAAAKVFKAKGRPATNPLIIHVADKAQIDSVAVVSDDARKLIDAFMPGALTLVLPKRGNVPDIVTAGYDTVAVRMPDHKVALELIKEAGVPVCAPSANTSARPSPTRAMHVYDDLKGKIPVILDGGMCPLGLESTIVDMTQTPPKVLRAGAVAIDEVEKVIGDLDTEKVMVDTLAALKIPAGYVPKAELVFSAFYDNMSDVINKYYDSNKLTHGARPVIFCMNFNMPKYGNRNVMPMGESVAEYAKLLFERIREAENLGYNLIIAEGVPMGGMGTTVLSRLIKLSGGKVI